jgi:hypothetical protein
MIKQALTESTVHLGFSVAVADMVRSIPQPLHGCSG